VIKKSVLGALAVVIAVAMTACGASEDTGSPRAVTSSGTSISPAASSPTAKRSAPAASQSEDPWLGIKPVPGVTAYDFTSNLEQTWGLKFDSDITMDGMVKTGTAVDPDTGASLRGEITLDKRTQVRMWECSITGAQDAAASFLSFCATLPYDGSQPAQARDWVKAQLPTVAVGHAAETDFGSVHFSLLGSATSHTVEASGR
jgi:hypothetical protein